MWLRWIRWIAFVAGLYLIASPFIYGLTTNSTLMFTSMALGVVVLIVAFLGWYGSVVLDSREAGWLSWINVVLGLITIALSIAFAFTAGPMISYIITGIVIVIVSFFAWIGDQIPTPTAMRR